MLNLTMPDWLRRKKPNTTPDKSSVQPGTMSHEHPIKDVNWVKQPWTARLRNKAAHHWFLKAKEQNGLAKFYRRVATSERDAVRRREYRLKASDAQRKAEYYRTLWWRVRQDWWIDAPFGKDVTEFHNPLSKMLTRKKSK